MPAHSSRLINCTAEKSTAFFFAISTIYSFVSFGVSPLAIHNTAVGFLLTRSIILPAVNCASNSGVSNMCLCINRNYSFLIRSINLPLLHFQRFLYNKQQQDEPATNNLQGCNSSTMQSKSPH